MVINKTELNGNTFENVINISEISNKKVEMTLPLYEPSCKVNIPILCKKGDDFCVQNIQVPAFIAVGHELVHFIHKADAFQNSDKSDKALQAINNYNDHRDNFRAIATLWEYNVEKYGISEDDSGDFQEGGLYEFSAEEKGDAYNKNFEEAWGSTKAYEELKTITGKETNRLSKNTSNDFSFESFDSSISERHLLCDYFTKNSLPSSLKTGANKPFITRWTHALNAEEVKEGSFVLAKHLFSSEEISRLPNLE